jgi:hypothetical protein
LALSWFIAAKPRCKFIRAIAIAGEGWVERRTVADKSGAVMSQHFFTVSGFVNDHATVTCDDELFAGCHVCTDHDIGSRSVLSLCPFFFEPPSQVYKYYAHTMQAVITQCVRGTTTLTLSRIESGLPFLIETCTQVSPTHRVRTLQNFDSVGEFVSISVVEENKVM